jgi:hypothetical protein
VFSSSLQKFHRPCPQAARSLHTCSVRILSRLKLVAVSTAHTNNAADTTQLSISSIHATSCCCTHSNLSLFIARSSSKMLGRAPCDRQAVGRGSPAGLVAPLAPTPSSGLWHAHANRYVKRCFLISSMLAGSAATLRGALQISDIAAAIAADNCSTAHAQAAHQQAKSSACKGSTELMQQPCSSSSSAPVAANSTAAAARQQQKGPQCGGAGSQGLL